MPLNEETELGSKKYRVMWLETKLRKVYNGYPVAGTIVKTPGTYSIQFIPDEFLAGETEYEIKVKVMLQSRPLNSGPWTLVKNEELVHRFTTGSDSDSLEIGNIAYSYPVAGMGNFYPLEYNEGYLKLKRTQPTLTENITAVYTRSGGGSPLARAVTYDENAMEYSWTHPTLSRDRIWKMQLVQDYVPEPGGGGGGGGTTSPPADQRNSPSGGVGGPSVPAAARPEFTAFTGDVIHTLFFRTSIHFRFQDKIDEISDNYSTSGVASSAILPYTGEYMDAIEIAGNYQTDGGLVTAKVLSNETYSTSSTLKAKVLNKMPFNFGYVVPNASDWNSLDIDLPYEANEFQFDDPENPPAVVQVADFNAGEVTGADNGGKFFLGFAKGTRRLTTDLAYDAETSLIETVFGMLNQGGALAWGADCYPPAAMERINTLFGNSEMLEGGNDPTVIRLVASQVVQDILDAGGLPSQYCPIPSDLVDIALIKRNFTVLGITGDTYPIRYKYQLPGGKHQRTVNKTIGL